MVTDCTGANDSERGVTRKRPVSFWSFTYMSGFSSSAAELALKVIVHWQKRNKRRLTGQPTERQMWGDGSFLPWVGLGLAMPREAPFWAEIFYKNIYIFEVKFCMLEKSPHLGKLLHSWWDSLAPHRWQWTALLQARELPVAARNLLEKVSWPKWQGNMGLCPDVTVVEAGEKQCSSQYLPSSCWERCTGFSWHSFHSETPLQHVSGLR